MNSRKKEYLKVPFTGQRHPNKDCGFSCPFRRSRRIRIRFDSHSSGCCRCEQLPDGNGAAGRYRRLKCCSTVRPAVVFRQGIRRRRRLRSSMFAGSKSSVHRRSATPRPQPCSLVLLSLHVLFLCIVRRSRCGRRVVH